MLLPKKCTCAQNGGYQLLQNPQLYWEPLSKYRPEQFLSALSWLQLFVNTDIETINARPQRPKNPWMRLWSGEIWRSRRTYGSISNVELSLFSHTHCDGQNSLVSQHLHHGQLPFMVHVTEKHLRGTAQEQLGQSNTKIYFNKLPKELVNLALTACLNTALPHVSSTI